MDLQGEIVSALNHVAAADSEELVYFAATSKPEFQVRDRLAFRLHQVLGDIDPAFQVAREWKRIDLAVLKQGEPLAFIEAKAMTTYNVTIRGDLEGYRKRVQHDIENAHRRSQQAEVYALVIVTNILDDVAADLDGVIKYARRLRRHRSLGHATPEVIDKALEKFLPECDPPVRVTLAEGKAFELSVAVTAWLFGPISPDLTAA